MLVFMVFIGIVKIRCQNDDAYLWLDMFCLLYLWIFVKWMIWIAESRCSSDNGCPSWLQYAFSGTDHRLIVIIMMLV